MDSIMLPGYQTCGKRLPGSAIEFSDTTGTQDPEIDVAF